MSKRPTRWIHLSDLQLGHLSSRVKDNDARAHRLIERVVAEEPDFIINAGDHIAGAVNADPAERIYICAAIYTSTSAPAIAA